MDSSSNDFNFENIVCQMYIISYTGWTYLNQKTTLNLLWMTFSKKKMSVDFSSIFSLISISLWPLIRGMHMRKKVRRINILNGQSGIDLSSLSIRELKIQVRRGKKCLIGKMILDYIYKLSFSIFLLLRVFIYPL
jgi:hypothetical protein